MRWHALQYYEDFCAKSLEAGELLARATAAREMAAYASAQGVSYAKALRLREAEAWIAAAEQTLAKQGASAAMEHALLGAAAAYSSMGRYGSAVGVFARLSECAASAENRARYAGAAKRYPNADDGAADPAAVPRYRSDRVSYPDVWHEDVLEWENDGDPVEACREVLAIAETQANDRAGEARRRLAMVASVAWTLASEGVVVHGPGQRLGRLAAVGAYGMLSPLERLYDRGDAEERCAVLGAARVLAYKRTFVMVEKGARDVDVAVRVAAREALGHLAFPHAYDPLVRLHRDAPEGETRLEALRSIATIATPDAAEYLLRVIAEGREDERQVASRALARSRVPEVGSMLQSAIERERGSVRERLAMVAAARKPR